MTFVAVEADGCNAATVRRLRNEAMSNCQICNTPAQDDLFAYVTGEPVCSVCKVSYVGGLPTTPTRIALVREALGLKSGEFLKVDRLAEARRILDRWY